MIPNYSNTILQQQQQQHLQQQQQQQHQNLQQQAGQQQQQQQQLPQALPQEQSAMNQTNMDQARMQQWYRQNAATDMNHAKLAEMMKRNPSNNLFGRQQPQQTFAPANAMGIGMQQAANGTPVLGGNPQQQSFHEQHPSNILHPQAFANMGVMPNGNINAAASASLPARNPAGALPGPPHQARQLDMMAMAQGGQQPQNNPMNLHKFPQSQHHQLNQVRDPQQSQFTQASPADMFPDGLRRTSPHPSGAMNQNPGLGQASQQAFANFLAGRPLSNAELNNRFNNARNAIAGQEANYNAITQHLSSVRGNPAAEAQYIQKAKAIRLDIERKKDSLNKMNEIWKQLQLQQQGNIVGVNGGQSAISSWGLPQSNASQAFDPSNGQTSRQQSITLLPGQPTTQLQTSPNLPPVPVQNNFNSSIPPRNASTPQQPPQSNPPHAGAFNGMGAVPFAKNNSQNLSSQQAMPGVRGGNAMPNFVPPATTLGLDKAQFEAYLRIFFANRGTKIDQRLRLLENRPLDLHALHLQVMQEGGFSKVEGNDNLWSIMAARLGYVQFPGTATEPARSGPGVAQTIQHIYKEHIAPFESWYITYVQDSKKQQQQVHIYNTIQNSLAAVRSPYTPQQVLQMSSLSNAELQNQGVDKDTIQFMESHKGQLQRLLQDQRTFSESLRSNAQNANQGEQNGSMNIRAPNMGPPFGPNSSQQAQHQSNLALAMANRQQQQILQQQILQKHQQVGQHLQPTVQDGVDQIRAPPHQQPPSMQLQPPMGGGAMQNFQQKSINQALQFIEQLKNEYAMSHHNSLSLDVPMEQQVEFTQSLDQLHRLCAEAEGRLGPLALILKDEGILRKLVAIICAVNQQRVNLASASGPRYILTLDQVKHMANELGRINSIWATSFQTFKMHQKQQAQAQSHMTNIMAPPIIKQEQHPQGRPLMPLNRPPSVVPPPPPPQSQSSQPQPPQPQPTQQSQPPQNPTSGLRPPAPNSVPPPSKRKPPQTPGGTAALSPSPAPVASAPTPSAPTPTATASSPPSAKSPKTKATPKSKAGNAKPRRASKVIQSAAAAAAAAAASAAPPSPENTQPTPPSTSTTTTTGKRQREEESTPNSGGTNPESSEAANEGSPPKRIKTEWDSQPTEAQRKQSDVAANIKTDEDAATFITELIKMAVGAEDEGQPSSLSTGISETLDMLLKGYGSVPDAMDGFSGTSAGESSGGSREVDTSAGLGDPFEEFFDFSFGTVEDEDGKTPDLVSSSSTNPSPESNHDSETVHHLLTSTSSSTLDIKTEDLSDPLRLGTWKEIDGGEAAYYQTMEWRWDSPMASFDQPWAIS